LSQLPQSLSQIRLITESYEANHFRSAEAADATQLRFQDVATLPKFWRSRRVAFRI
jgi:hypothetical protein